MLEAQVLLRAARLDAHLTKFEEARELNDRAKGTFEELGLVSDVAQAEWNGGVIESLAGEPGTAAMHLEIACRVFEGRGERGRSSRAGLALAEADLTLGKFEDALAWTQFAERTGTLEDVEIKVRGRLLRSKLVARRGWFEDAEGRGREAVALAERTDLLDLQTEALLGLADALIAGGKAADAGSILEGARSLCEWKAISSCWGEPGSSLRTEPRDSPAGRHVLHLRSLVRLVTNPNAAVLAQSKAVNGVVRSYPFLWTMHGGMRDHAAATRLMTAAEPKAK